MTICIAWIRIYLDLETRKNNVLSKHNIIIVLAHKKSLMTQVYDIELAVIPSWKYASVMRISVPL